MNESAPAPAGPAESQESPDDRVFAEFVNTLEAAEDADAVVREYEARYPHLAAEFRPLAALNRMMDRARPVPDEAVPARLGGFRLVRRLACSGMGEVFEAVQERLQRRVAVKIIRRGRDSAGRRARFLREQRVLARLHHTHIVPILTAGEVGTLQYFVMPYIAGVPLSQVVHSAWRHESSRPGGRTPTLTELAGTAEPGAAPTPPPADTPVRLSSAYFRSVARVLADAARALQHTHEANLLHRDVKPANLLVEPTGQCWVIDFGLAGYLRRPDGPEAEETPLGPDPFAVTGVAGTPQYMAPEQWTEPKKVDARADVWGLGATLYEMLTLRRAFDGPDADAVRASALGREPVAPRRLVRNVPRDLEAVCRRALRKDPARRYPTAGAFADDLDRWLRGEPTTARPAWPLRRLALWARRNKGWAAALLVTCLTALLVAGGAVLFERAQAREQHREALLQQVQRVRLGPREAGWSDDAWELVRAAAGLRPGPEVQSQAAAVLAGLDARRVKKLPHGGSAVAFDRDGRRLLVGGLAAQATRLWDAATDQVVESRPSAPGPVAFRADGTPLQLVSNPRDRQSVLLWDVGRQRPVQEFAVADGGDPAPASSASPLLLALTPDGGFLAAATHRPDGRGTVRVWEAASGRLLTELGVRVATLALAPDGRLLAGGDADGRISVWSLPDSNPLLRPPARGTAIRSLAFGRDPRHRAAGEDDPPGSPWLLASGDAGGGVVVWDLHTGLPRAFGHGSNFDVLALAFSPDGATLASAGRSAGRLWDTATGRPLLILPTPDYATGLAFSPDGRQLAACNRHAAGPDFNNAVVFELERGRGLWTLHGLDGAVVQVCFSPDDRLLAALSVAWQIGVWDLQTGALVHVLDAPRGLVADNAALAFDASGRQLAAASGTGARLWEVVSAKELGSWNLPWGLADRLAFDAKGRLLLFRVETVDGQPPFGNVPWRQHPRVCRIRNLLGPDPARPLAEIHDFNRAVLDAAVTPNGSFFVATGRGGPDGKQRTLRVYDGLTGKEHGSLLLDPEKHHGFYLDPTGRLLADCHDGRTVLREVPSLRTCGELEGGTLCVGPPAGYRLHGTLNPLYQLVLTRGQDRTPLVAFDLDRLTAVGRFSLDGTRCAMGLESGDVMVSDFPEVRRRLGQLGLGW
jgi:eukaryotic-like serine/threonine-protein kinase